jgi:heat shock protein 4
MESIRSVVGPIAQRYFDKEEEKRQAVLAQRAESEAMKKAQEELAKGRAEQKGDEEMKDADQKPSAGDKMDMET